MGGSVTPGNEFPGVTRGNSIQGLLGPFCGILWGAALLVVALVNLIWGGYGQRFLEDVPSFYPGYKATRSIVQVAIVTVYGFAGK